VDYSRTCESGSRRLSLADQEIRGCRRGISIRSPGQSSRKAERESAIPFDIPGVELGHHDGKSSFEAIVAKYQINDPAIHLLAQIVHGADVKQDLYGRPEAPGLKAIAEGFGYLGLKDDHEILQKEFVVYDALFSYCRRLASL